MKWYLAMLFLIGACFACPSSILPVCGSNHVDYANESMIYYPNSSMVNPPIALMYCGTCYQFDQYVNGFNLYGNYSTSQLNNTNSSYLVRYIGAQFGALVGNDEFGQDLLAIIVGGFFVCFVSFQNTRIEAKMAVLIPAFILAAAFVSWLLSILALVIGIILYLGLSKLFNK